MMSVSEEETINCETGYSPTVSICIPAYNYARFLPDAIESVLAQTFRDFELVIVDNCSTDATAEVVKQYAARDHRIRYVCNEVNVGAQENLNRCIRNATGEFVKILCADDLLAPECIARMVAVFAEHPTVSLVASGRQLADASLRPIRKIAYSHRFRVLPSAQVINHCLFNGNYIGEPSAVLFRRQDALRGFDTTYAQLIDLEMWFHLLEQGDFACIPDALCIFRQHEAQETKGNRRAFAFLDEEERFYREFSAKPMVRATFLNRLLWRTRIAHYIWRDRRAGDNYRWAREKMRRYMTLHMFIILFPLISMVRKVVKGYDRLLAMLEG